MKHGVIDNLPRIKAVAPAKRPFTLRVTWTDGARDDVDLTGLIHRSRHFNVFASDPAALRRVRVIDYGAAIGWANGLDYSADTLKTLADEQRPMAGAELAAFEAKFGLNTAETATLLEIAERTVRLYRGAEKLPQPIAVALRAMAANDTVLAAHYRPATRRLPGRPKKAVAA
jgi:hypothetical protein